MSEHPPLGPQPRQSRGVKARRQIYEAAMREFAEKGSGEARVEDIVEQAGQSWGTFYRWFPRKQDVLLEAAVRHVRDHVAPDVEEALAAAREPARAVCLRFFLALLSPGDHPAHVHGDLLLEVTHSRERFTAMLGEGETPMIEQIAQIVSYGQERGEVRTDLDPYSLAGVLMAGTTYSITYGYYGPFRGLPGAAPAVDLAALIERMFGIAWRGLEAAPAPIG